MVPKPPGPIRNNSRGLTEFKFPVFRRVRPILLFTSYSTADPTVFKASPRIEINGEATSTRIYGKSVGKGFLELKRC